MSEICCVYYSDFLSARGSRISALASRRAGEFAARDTIFGLSGQRSSTSELYYRGDGRISTIRRSGHAKTFIYEERRKNVCFLRIADRTEDRPPHYFLDRELKKRKVLPLKCRIGMVVQRMTFRIRVLKDSR